MKRVILLSQLICMPILFAPRDSRGKGSIAPREIPPIAPREMQSSPSREIASIDGLDCAMFKHWYGDCFKTKEIDGVSYFIELPERETKSPFVLLGMSAYIQVSSWSVSVPGVVESIFRTSNGRAARFKYTMRQKIEFGEVKDMFGSMVPKVKQMMQNMLDELNDACGYGYEDHLPLDSIEVQDESGIIYLICGIAQQSPVAKNHWISEPESIRIRIKASNQCPESRMSRKHLLAQVSVPTSCPEFYMSRKYLGMYHTIYSALNTELVGSLTPITDPENFCRIEGYSLIPDILQKKRNKAMDYLEEDELEPSIYIPTYQYDMLAKGEDYESLVFINDDKNDEKCSSCCFKTEVVNGFQYTLCLYSDKMKEAGLGDTFRLSDLIGKEIKPDRLDVSFFCPAPGKFKQSSGNTEFRYTYSLVKEDTDESESESIDVFRNAELVVVKKALQEVKTLIDDIITKLSKIKSVEFPLAMIDITEGYIRSIKLIPSDEGNKLNTKFVGPEGPTIEMNFRKSRMQGTSLDKNVVEKLLTEKHLMACCDVYKLLRRKIHNLLKDVTEFDDDLEYYERIPGFFKKQSFWRSFCREIGGEESEDELNSTSNVKTDDCSVLVEIPYYLRDALMDRQHEFLTFTRDNGNVFKTEKILSAYYSTVIYSLTLSDRTGLDDTCRLSDLRDKEIISLSLLGDDHFSYTSYSVNKTIPGNEVSEQFKIASQKIKSYYGTLSISIYNEYIEISNLRIPLTDQNTEEKLFTEERLKVCRDLSDLIIGKIHELLGVPEVLKRQSFWPNELIPEVLKKQSFWPEVQAVLNQIGDDVSVYIPEYLCAALVLHDQLVDIDKKYSLLKFTYWYDNWFKTRMIDDLEYMLNVKDRSNLSNTFSLSDLADKKIDGLCTNTYAPAPGKLKQSNGNTAFRYKVIKDIAGNEVSYQFQIASEKAKKLRDASIAQLSKIKSVDFPLAVVGISESEYSTWLYMIPSDKGKKLNPKSTTSEAPRLDIKIHNVETMEKILTQEKVVKCRNVCGLIRNKVHELLGGVTEFSDKEDYVDAPNLLTKQSFCPEVEAMLRKIGPNVSINIPHYLRDALVDKHYEFIPFTRDNGNVFKTEEIDNLICILTLSDATGLGDILKLSDLADKEITSLSVNIGSGSYNECRYNINKTIPGNEVSEQFKIASQKVKKLYNLNDRAMASVSDECIEIETPEYKGKKLNPKSTTSEGPKLKIPLSDENTEEKLLTKERLKVCDDVCKLVKTKIHELLKDVTEFNAGEDYVPVPDVLKRQSFWPEAEAMLKKIGDDVSISIPRYLHNALIDKLV